MLGSRAFARECSNLPGNRTHMRMQPLSFEEGGWVHE